MKKIAIMFLLIICMSFLLCGCWDKMEIDRLAVVKILSISDDPKSDDLIVSADISDFSDGSDSEKSDKKKDEGNVITGKGRTLSDAFNNLESLYNRKLILSHNKILILSKEYAKKGITNIVDTLERNLDFRNTTYVMVSEIPPIEIMKSKINLEKKNVSGIEMLIRLTSSDSKIFSTEWYTFLLNLKNASRTAITPLIKMNDKSEILIDSSAVFKDDKMIGILSQEQTKSCQWFLNNVKDQSIDIPYHHDDKDSVISMEILRGNYDVKPVKYDNNIEMNINCDAIALIKGITNSQVELQDYNVINKINEQTNEYFKSKLENVILFSEKSLNADILGFGNKINANMPITWKNLKNNWDEEFPNIKYNVTFNIKVKDIGISKDTIKNSER